MQLKFIVYAFRNIVIGNDADNQYTVALCTAQDK